MTVFRWLSIFILGACFGYGVAIFVASEHDKTEVMQPEKQPVSTQGQVAHQAIAIKPGLTQNKQARGQENKPQEETTLKLEEAYIALVKEAVAKREFTTALALLADAENQFGATTTRLILLAEVQILRKDFTAARANLHQVLTIDSTVAERVYPMLRQVVTALIQGDALTFKEKVQMLSEELIDDPGFVTYYTLLGRLHYAQENYADAITNLEYALQLDHNQTATLSPLIDAAKRRLENPGLVEVPISAHGRALNVDVRLNDVRQSFRFILDTGATFTVISSETAQRLGLVLSPDLPTIQISTANGLVQAPAVILNAVNLHGALVERVPAVVMNELNGFDGLLGLSFLNHFNIDINQDEGKLLLLKHSN